MNPDQPSAASFQRSTGEGGDYMRGMDLTAATKTSFVQHFLPEGARVYVDVGTGTGKVPAEIGQMNGRGGLTPIQLMQKFLETYEPAKGVTVTVSSDGKSFTMPAWLLQEYLMMRTFNYSEKDWQKEQGERRGVFNAADVTVAAQRHDMRVIVNKAVYEQNYYAGVRQADGEGITISGQNGQPLTDQDLETRFPSHNYVVLEKS